MFVFNYEGGASAISVWLVWILVFVLLFALNEVTRRSKKAGFLCFIIMPIILSVLWFTVLSDTTYTDWFHLAKVYSSTAGCIGFWCIRHLHGKNKKTGKEWHLSDSRFALCFPPLILAINICEAVVRDIEVGLNYAQGGFLADEAMYVLGGPWNFMNAAAGIINIIAITGWFGICIRKKTDKDGSKDMLWPDMMWFWIVAYDIWNFAYTYNCLPGHAWYCGFALLLVPTVCAFTIGKGAWLQHRAHTLALWCMFAQTFPSFIDSGKFAVSSTYNTTALTIWSFAAVLVNIVVLVFMIYKTIKTKRNPYKGELYIDMRRYQEVKSFAE
ncbi:putative membrane protein [Clostridium argentinense CDC 2741]|uniref:Putative membrane protein n=1 Tax=Clostridium argentinense CDC 2741 TaxID=1418104 RepID=A0A0C1RBN1_9CLOT|nr:DUF5692 family protein [Clostridium argentinense]ARC86121.1 hypothetical protein RSJ17_17285 [Clostridium argentinense]KIE47816.1 putative membrane protein [Clostridium argentinense CDC 2741]NFF40368.1 hypothetical protein [Clostridium argentinense]NFP50175.1 hypothetical protein [Clostridium argentinense]NFP72690.1 hypothetical protein [Clostridium argentinense]